MKQITMNFGETLTDNDNPSLYAMSIHASDDAIDQCHEIKFGQETFFIMEELYSIKHSTEREYLS